MHLALSNTHNTGNELGSEIVCTMYQARGTCMYAVRIKITMYMYAHLQLYMIVYTMYVPYFQGR
jgi:hypothetical protein